MKNAKIAIIFSYYSFSWNYTLFLEKNRDISAKSRPTTRGYQRIVFSCTHFQLGCHLGTAARQVPANHTGISTNRVQLYPLSARLSSGYSQCPSSPGQPHGDINESCPAVPTFSSAVIWVQPMPTATDRRGWGSRK
ncbi:hypothetical protein JTB14_002860 [Gonioctena quinquepunctata]|nr:hypothetical protein JTB14_002860 [Gonioctena quinquepunctata]